MIQTHPRLAKQWSARNGALTPEMVSAGSHKRIWWICEQGHQWQAAVCARVRGNGCPICANRVILPGYKVLSGFNDLATLAPDVAAQWHSTLNGALTPQMVTVGSNRKVWWVCPKGHIWRATVANRALPGYKRTGCPVCAGRVKSHHYAADAVWPVQTVKSRETVFENKTY